MILLLDALGERYGMLPSQVMCHATTFDVFVCDTAIGYRNEMQDREMSGGKPKVKTENYKQEDLRAMLERTKKKGQDGKN